MTQTLEEFLSMWRLRAKSSVPTCTAEDAAEVVRQVEALLAAQRREYRSPEVLP
jgi:hypothetical protein